MKRFFVKFLLITSVFYFSDLYCMQKFLKRYFCCCCCCCCKDDDEVEFTQEDTRDFVEKLKNSSQKDIDREIEEFAQQVREQIKGQPKQVGEKVNAFFKRKRLKLKKWFAQHKKRK